MNIDELKVFIREMAELKDNLSLIATYIDTAQSYLETPSKKIRDYYTINDEPFDHDKIASIKEELIAKKERIKNVFIPEIDSKVGLANQDIARLEEEARRREEQARIEEENRRRAERELAEASARQSSSAPQPQQTTTVAQQQSQTQARSQQAPKTLPDRRSVGAQKQTRYIERM